MPHTRIRACCPHCSQKPVAHPQHFGKQVACPACSKPFLVSKLDIPPAILDLLPTRLVDKYHVLPLAVDEEAVTVAMGDSADLDVLDTLRFKLGRPFKCVTVSSEALHAEITRHYHHQELKEPEDVVLPLVQNAPALRHVHGTTHTIVCRCEGCDTEYALGVNATATTRADVLRMQKANGGADGSLPQLPDDADLVALLEGASSWPQGKVPPQPDHPVQDELQEDRRVGRTRQWQCDGCKTIQPYPWCGGSTDDQVADRLDDESLTTDERLERAHRAKQAQRDRNEMTMAQAVDQAHELLVHLASEEALRELCQQFGSEAVRLFDGAARTSRAFNCDPRTERVAGRQPTLNDYLARYTDIPWCAEEYTVGILETITHNRDSTAVCERFIDYMGELCRRAGQTLVPAGPFDALLAHLQFLHFLADKYQALAACKGASELTPFLDRCVENILPLVVPERV